MKTIKETPNYAAFIAIDWADQKHTCCLQAAGQNKKEAGTLEQKPEVIGPWVARLRERFCAPAGGRRGRTILRGAHPCPVELRLPRALYPIHPTTVADG